MRLQHDEYSGLACVGSVRCDPRREIGRYEVVKPRHGLLQALRGAVFPDYAIALHRRREVAAPGHTGAAAEILEDDGLSELHRLNVDGAAVAVDDALGRRNL